MAFLVTTTGAAGTIVLNDLSGRVLTHPVSALDLELEYDIEDLRDSADLQAAITAGYITVTDGLGNTITSLSKADDVRVSISPTDTTPNYLQSKIVGTTNRISKSILSPGANESLEFDIASNYTGQTSITTLGTITSGTWNGTAIDAIRGGTGLTTYTTGDILYASATNVLSKLPIGTNGQHLLIAGGVPSWGAAGGTGTVTSVSGSGGTTGLTLSGGPITTSGTLTLGGTLAIANGGTGQTAKAAAFNALSPNTTKGDITVYSTTNVRQAVGTNGQVLIADSAQATGVRWANADSIAGQTIRFLNSNTGNSNTVVSTTTETNFTGNGTNYSMPANTMNANSLLRFLVYGKFGTKGGSVGTLTIRLKIGSLVINTTGIDITPGSNQTDVGFQFTGQIQCRTSGVSGTVASHLLCVFNGAGASAATTFCDSSNGTNTIDTTIANTIQMSAQWATSNANNTITIEQVTMEILN